MKRNPLLFIPAFLTLIVIGAVLYTAFWSAGFSRAQTTPQATPQTHNPDLVTTLPGHLPRASFAGGCFWCVESEFRPLRGVVFTRVGYAGGETENPRYQDIITGMTGHAETVEIYYDPQKIRYQALVDHFLRNAHDPTTLNRQWVDEGTQYRSMIFYHDAAQEKIARATIKRINAEKIYPRPIVTELVPAGLFWPAEEEHQQYYQKYEQEKGTPHIREVLKGELKKKKAAEARSP